MSMDETADVTEQQDGLDIRRRNLLKLTGAGAAALGMLSVTNSKALRRCSTCRA